MISTGLDEYDSENISLSDEENDYGYNNDVQSDTDEQLPRLSTNNKLDDFRTQHQPMSNQSNNNQYHLLQPAQQLNYFQQPVIVPQYPPSSQQQYQFIQQQQTQTQEPKKARKM